MHGCGARIRIIALMTRVAGLVGGWVDIARRRRRGARVVRSSRATRRREYIAHSCRSWMWCWFLSRVGRVGIIIFWERWRWRDVAAGALTRRARARPRRHSIAARATCRPAFTAHTRMAQTEVTWEDQQRICAFSRMNARAHELAAELKATEKRVEDYEEASTELVVNDEDDVSFLLGECFVKMDNDSAETRLEKLIQVEKGKLEALKAERKALADGMSELKKVRFCERRRRRRRRRVY